MTNELYDQFLKEPHIISKAYTPTGKEKNVDTSQYQAVRLGDEQAEQVIIEQATQELAKNEIEEVLRDPLACLFRPQNKPVKSISLNELKKFKIVSTDGLASSTKIYYGDEEVQGIADATISINAETNLVLATFTVLAPICNIEVPRPYTRIQDDSTSPDTQELCENIINSIKHEFDSIPKEDLNQDNSA